jgi:TonB family protein
VASYVGFAGEEMAVTTTKGTMVMAFVLKPTAIDGSKMPISVPPPPPGPDNGEVFTVVENVPEYPGGQRAMYTFIGNTIRYPKEAIRRKVQGKVFVNFIVGKDGSLSRFRVLRGIGAGCDQEAVRVMKMMPKWVPGRQNGQPVAVMYNLPVAFQLEEGKKVSARTQPKPAYSANKGMADAVTQAVLGDRVGDDPKGYASIRIKDVVNHDRQPLLIVDGKEVKQGEMSKIDQKTISQVNVYKDEYATAKYGEKGKHGVVEIKTKEAKE